MSIQICLLIAISAYFIINPAIPCLKAFTLKNWNSPDLTVLTIRKIKTLFKQLGAKL